MNFKEEKIDKKLESETASLVRRARSDIKPDKNGLFLILEKLDVTKFDTSRSYRERELVSNSFFENRKFLTKSFFGVGFVTAVFVAFLISAINVDLSRGDFGYQISSLEAEAQVIEEDFTSGFDEQMLQEELDMEFAVLEDELGL